MQQNHNSDSSILSKPKQNIPGTHIEVAALTGYGFTNNYKFGLGGRITFPLGHVIFIGLSYLNNFGRDTTGTFTYTYTTSSSYYDTYTRRRVTTTTTHVATEDGKISENAYNIGADLGMNIPVSSSYAFRPYFEPGLAVFHTKTTAPDIPTVTKNKSHFYIATGASIQCYLSSHFFLGIDARHSVIADMNGYSIDGLYLTIGI
jgi:hypothetical protein